MQVTEHPRLRIAWLLTAPIVGSGGYTNIFRIINLLASFGHEQIIFMNPSDYPTEALDRPEHFVQRYFGVVHAPIYFWPQEIKGFDIVLATQWTTTQGFEMCDPAITRAYFVQDFEPFFYAMGDEWLSAEATYKQGWPCITLGHWLAKHLHEQYQATTFPFDFAVEHERYYPRPKLLTKKPRVIFYARPSTPRRCFDLGMRALAIVKEQRPDVEIVLFGDKHLKHFSAPFKFTAMGILNPEELAELYASATLGLVISSTNPSLMPPEMMASGCPVVDIDLAPNHFLVTHGKTGLLATAEPKPLAQALLSVLSDEPLRQRLIKAGLEHAKTLRWESSAREVEKALVKLVTTASGTINQRLLTDHEHLQGDGVSAALNADFNIGQRLVCQHDGVCGFEVALAQPASGSWRLQIYDALINPNRSLVDVESSSIDQQWLHFDFPALPASRNQALHFVVSSANGSSVRFDFRAAVGGSLSFNHMPQLGQLCCRVLYAAAYDTRERSATPEVDFLRAQQALANSEYILLSEFTERLHNLIVPKKTWQERSKKTLQLIRSGKFNHLALEAKQYGRWMYDRAKAQFRSWR
ncbi:glycosyltransferase family 4 protein [Herpetosiphon sp. NSE202]|uniref:glycosyltransferase family 4 protein n=1 Tax=Herpetosiphon sp. NSE202 TaxID=3351349 RepID=UPI00363F186F